MSRATYNISYNTENQEVNMVIIDLKAAQYVNNSKRMYVFLLSKIGSIIQLHKLRIICAAQNYGAKKPLSILPTHTIIISRSLVLASSDLTQQFTELFLKLKPTHVKIHIYLYAYLLHNNYVTQPDSLMYIISLIEISYR